MRLVYKKILYKLYKIIRPQVLKKNLRKVYFKNYLNYLTKKDKIFDFIWSKLLLKCLSNILKTKNWQKTEKRPKISASSFNKSHENFELQKFVIILE